MRHSTRLKRRSCVLGAMALVFALFLGGCADNMMLFSDRHDTRNLTLSKTDSKTDARDLSTTVYNVLSPANVDLTGDGIADATLTQEQVEALEAQGWNINVI